MLLLIVVVVNCSCCNCCCCCCCRNNEGNKEGKERKRRGWRKEGGEGIRNKKRMKDGRRRDEQEKKETIKKLWHWNWIVASKLSASWHRVSVFQGTSFGNVGQNWPEKPNFLQNLFFHSKRTKKINAIKNQNGINNNKMKCFLKQQCEEISMV